MANYKSDRVAIDAPAEKVFARLSNLEGLRDLIDNMPEERVPEEQREMLRQMTVTPDSITIPGGPVGSLTLRRSRLEEPSLIEMKGEGTPVPLTLSLHIDPNDPETCEAYASIDLEIPAIMKPMISGPMNQMVSQFGKVLGALKF